MKRLMLPAGVALVALAPGTAMAKPPTAVHVRAYERAYRQVAHRFGRRVPGRNIVKDGVAQNRPATDAETVASLGVLERMLVAAQPSAPSQAAAPSSSAVTTSVPASTSTSGLPGCASESGSNYSTGGDNTNGSSGATGRYQITPSTAANYG